MRVIYKCERNELRVLYLSPPHLTVSPHHKSLPISHRLHEPQDENGFHLLQALRLLATLC
ncbi:hypothetical protein J6590_022391 [Homalodisca vitripennis]|nr:hypothetical protein J6590_022391 [Homalodisca vitripennis]